MPLLHLLMLTIGAVLVAAAVLVFYRSLEKINTYNIVRTLLRLGNAQRWDRIRTVVLPHDYFKRLSSVPYILPLLDLGHKYTDGLRIISIWEASLNTEEKQILSRTKDWEWFEILDYVYRSQLRDKFIRNISFNLAVMGASQLLILLGIFAFIFGLQIFS